MPSPNQNSNKKQSQQAYSFAWLRHGCCVPTTSVLWMIVVLFVFTVITFIFCCLAMFVVRWMYKRRIRKKSEILRVKYKKEDEIRRETEYKLKEIALRPIQTHFYQPCGDPFHGAPPDAQRQSYSERYRPESFQGRVSDRREIPSNQMPPSPGDGLVKRGLFTGLTPLSASTQHPLFPGRQEVEGGTTGPSTGQTGLKERSTAMTSSTHTAVSTTTIGPTPATSTTYVQMDPKDVATTVHTIAKDYRSKDDRPPAPGLMLISKRKKSNDSIASDILVPTDQVTTGKTTTSASGVTSATSATTHPSATTRTTTTGTTRTGTTPISSEVAVSPQAHRGSERDRKRRKSAPKPGGAVKVIEMNKQMMTGPQSRSYFPYWTAQKSVSTSVEPNVSPSGRVLGTKVATSEVSSWMPTGRQTSSRFTTITSDRGDSRESRSPDVVSRPRDVYELRRELERMRANEISRGMQEVLEETRKHPATAAKPSPLPITPDTANQASERTPVTGPVPENAEPPEFTSAFAALRAAFQKEREKEKLSEKDSSSGAGSNR